ncbi:phage head closure protein [Aerococcus sp. UMB8608]|uniref:Phage head-tail adapter protein n=1 Tax=Aerococcus sanguinicola TaxID=119206 RepID=A0A0X8FCU1_9LACT|nr:MULTISPECIES: phage head closure protein [Aerococcus]AMB94903.1 hypothetical protein AWM72_09110 [Aerococcus sanguinicola]MDK6679351.1 phage head closure protein [Aerococcus sp. UMB8608]MDK6685807.1 phage head closure protein [Aerococcus sp. UMB8623]OFT95888.1 hypothetical protein HMPREF3090_03445 [Aerococcus sp. HMSC23C02]
MWNDEVILIKSIRYMDKTKNHRYKDKETRVLCKTSSISSSEFYRAAEQGFNPEINIVVHSYEYDGERRVRYKDVVYKVIRSYRASFEETELVCEVAKGVN